jgi:hypothetical protein
MKTQIVKRFVFGLLSSLLLAAGFAHAADRLDPMSLSLRGPILQADDPAPPCVDPGDGDR